MQRTNPIVIGVSAAVVAVAIILVAYFFTHKPRDDADPREVACIQDGGHWDELNRFCVHL